MKNHYVVREDGLGIENKFHSETQGMQAIIRDIWHASLML